MGFWFGFDTGFDIMRVFVFAIFAIVIVCFIALAVKGIGTWHKNNNSPAPDGAGGCCRQAAEYRCAPPQQ